MTTGFESFPNDDFFPDIANLFIDMGDVNGSAAAAAAATTAPYVFILLLIDMLLEFLLVVVALDWICLSTVLVDRMISFILLILVINCLPISWIKSATKLLIYSIPSTCCSEKKGVGATGEQPVFLQIMEKNGKTFYEETQVLPEAPTCIRVICTVLIISSVRNTGHTVRNSTDLNPSIE